MAAASEKSWGKASALGSDREKARETGEMWGQEKGLGLEKVMGVVMGADLVESTVQASGQAKVEEWECWRG